MELKVSYKPGSGGVFGTGGKYSVSLNGEDITDKVGQMSVAFSPGEPPRIKAEFTVDSLELHCIDANDAIDRDIIIGSAAMNDLGLAPGKEAKA